MFENEQKPQENALDEQWKKSIPAQVFLNHFVALNYYIQHSDDRYELRDVKFFNQLKQNPDADSDALQRLIYNAWNTEFALRNTAKHGDKDYLRYALHWAFPQAFYSVFLGMQAFYSTVGVRDNNFERLSREFGNMVANGAYPRAISFYADGHYGRFHLHRMRPAKFKPSLFPPVHYAEAEAQIGQFLFTTRKQKAKEVRARVQANPQQALRSAKTGNILQKFSKTDWEQITWRLGYTTMIDLLGRLKLSANHHEIERFVHADIDFTLFHEALCGIVYYLNFVHEGYIAKAIGFKNYKALVAKLPAHLRDGFVAERMEKFIAPLFGPQTLPMANAA
ncbi:MAG: hypothetical protein EOP53_17295 [Sphingobacteriales bacterium]|nr:MAG: hypothetical protein EOP53_17295 [Sphingobacteriales bacterium]